MYFVMGGSNILICIMRHYCALCDSQHSKTLLVFIGEKSVNVCLELRQKKFDYFCVF